MIKIISATFAAYQQHQYCSNILIRLWHNSVLRWIIQYYYF